MRLLILAIAVTYAVNSLLMLILPQFWYDTVPGISMLGPYNTHLVRDVGIVYLVSAGGFAWGLRTQRAGFLLMASAWPALHAIYHLQVWAARGFPVDIILAVNVLGIQAPAWLAVWAAIKLEESYVKSGNR